MNTTATSDSRHPSEAQPRPFLREERSADGVLRLVLDRPESFNALSEGMLEAFGAALDRIEGDAGVRVVIVAAEGKAFSAGHDLRQMRAQPSQGYYAELFGHCARTMMRLQRLAQPVIAQVQGVATAAGCQLVASCDLAVAAEGARFAVSGVNLGLFCSSPAVALSRNVGRKAAFEMLATGDFIDAQEARRIGLVNRVVPAGELDAAVQALAAKLVAKPAQALAMGKALFYRQLEAPGLSAAYDDAVRTMARNMMEPTALEGVLAFVEKRKPNW